MRKRKVVSIDDMLANDPRHKTLTKYRKTIGKATGDETHISADKKIKVGNFSLRTRIKNSPFLKSRSPSSTAIKWLHQEVFKDSKKYANRSMMMIAGGLHTFEYKNPKFKDTLEYFDKYPLVLSLGPIVTKAGKIRNLGMNLHFLPPKVRIVVLCRVFDLYARAYRYQVFYKTTTPVRLKWQNILKATKKYGVEFSVRLYIPQRQRVVVKFPIDDWHKAIFIPSRGFTRTNAQELVKKWRKFIRDKKFSTNPNLNWQANV